ncbi:cold-shock protein [Pseudoalteromonas marina]|uniref:Cold shock domain-containing protein n=1 Tax=Pseudoalteromonas marina TaxID=267375 RepID=A0ABT9FC45_9GAMM|nr:cold shock domain-containing protein [Pseudoalteromonas marina]MDP2564303.1 cold shock domain-containing protein [Pseudoalteromonas marina]
MKEEKLMQKKTGIVKWFNAQRGYGFIVSESVDEDIILHHSEIQMDGYRKLNPGDKVTFELDETRKEGISALNVVKI